MRLANVDALKRQLGDGEVIPYADLLRVCQEAGAARTRAEAAALAGALDEAGVVLLFCDRVYLQPDKVNSHCIAALSYPSPPSSPPRFAGSPPSRLGLPVLLTAGCPCLFVRCLNSRMTHQPIPCGAGLPVRPRHCGSSLTDLRALTAPAGCSRNRRPPITQSRRRQEETAPCPVSADPLPCRCRIAVIHPRAPTTEIHVLACWRGQLCMCELHCLFSLVHFLRI